MLIRMYLPLLVCIFWHVELNAQCCSPGNPIGGTSILGINEDGGWKLFFNYRYGYAGRYFEGAVPSNILFIRDGHFNHVGMSIAYGLSERMTLESEWGYFLNKTQRYVGGITPQIQKGHGFTDVNLSLKLNLWRNELGEWEITTGIGGKIPLGNNKQTFQGIILPRDLQPTTGAYDLVHTLFVHKGFLSRKFRTFLTTRTELKGRSQDQYRYGHLFVWALFGSYGPGIRWVFVGQFRGELRGRDSRPASGSGIPIAGDREKVIPTGSQKFFFIPQVSYSFSPGLQLSFITELPLYQYYNDRQLSSTVSFLFGLGFSFGGESLNQVIRIK